MVTPIEKRHVYEWFNEECQRLGIDPQSLDIDAEADWSLDYYSLIDELATKWAGYGFRAPWSPELVEVVKVKPERVRKLESELKKLREEKKRWVNLRDFERARLLERIEELKKRIKEQEKPEAPPKPKPEQKFKVGEKAFHPVEKEVTVLAAIWNEPAGKWVYVVEGRRHKKRQFFEDELIKLPELPPPPPRAPRAPAAPPRPLEEIIKEFEEKTGVRLERLIHVRVARPEVTHVPVSWAEMTEEQRREYAATGVTPTREQVVERVEMVEAAPYGLFYHGSDGRYYEVKDYQVVPIPYDKILERIRRAMRPLIPAPTRAPRLPFAPPPIYKPPGAREAEDFRRWLSGQGIAYEKFLTLDDKVRREFVRSWRIKRRGPYGAP